MATILNLTKFFQVEINISVLSKTLRLKCSNVKMGRFSYESIVLMPLVTSKLVTIETDRQNICQNISKE